MSRSGFAIVVFFVLVCGCQPQEPPSEAEQTVSDDAIATTYTSVRLAPSIDGLSDPQREMVPELIGAAQAMDAVFWEQAYGNRDSLLQSIQDPARRRYAEANYGPWDRLRDHRLVVPKAGPRPPGANFYPGGLSAGAVRRASASTPGLLHPRTMVRRLPDGSLTALPYHLFFGELMTTAAYHLRDAASLSSSTEVKRYLEHRASLLVGADSMTRDNVTIGSPPLHILIGAIPTGEDRLLGVKASASALVLRRDDEQTESLRNSLNALSDPERENAVSDSLLQVRTGTLPSAYDALYVAGGLNAGPKQVAHSLPSGLAPGVSGQHLVLLPNIAQSKVDSILTPVAETTLVPRLRRHVTGEAFLNHTLIANAVGTGSADTSSVAALGVDEASTLSLAMSLVSTADSGADSLQYAVTGLAHLLHTAHLDSTTTAGRAASVLFSTLKERKALSREDETGLLTVDPTVMARALPSIVRDWNRSPETFVDRHSGSPVLRSALARLDEASIPKALDLRQGLDVLGLESGPTASR